MFSAGIVLATFGAKTGEACGTNDTAELAIGC